jgi:hypothetical protein
MFEVPLEIDVMIGFYSPLATYRTGNRKGVRSDDIVRYRNARDG